MCEISKDDLKSPSKFKKKFYNYIGTIRTEILSRYNIDFDIKEIGDLLLSICRCNDFNVISKKGNKMFLDDTKVREWIDRKLIPNTVIMKMDDEDVVRLLVFCLEITYQMFAGGTRATTTQKGFRERRRTFESILVDKFVGKLGEIFVKKFLEKNFNITTIKLDWGISTQIEKYRNDIIIASKNISIKSSPNLTAIWAEAPKVKRKGAKRKGYDYGIMVKCSVPQHPILQFFIEVCGFSRLIDFAEKRIPSDDKLFKGYLDNIRERIKEYRCENENIQTSFKGFICGYFKTSKHYLKKEGEDLPYLGKVREERYLVQINELKWTIQEWENFLKEVGLL